MSLQGFYDAICQQAKNIENVDEKFSKATTDSDRFEFAFDLTQKFVKHIDVKPACKNWENSSNFRKEGNQLFIKYSYWEALVLFNKSISYAPNDSEELAIAFGNRASCLLRLGYPHEALKDVERGLTFNVPCSYRDKLQLRKKQCLDSIKTSTTSKLLFGDGVLPPLSRGQSTFFDNASKLVELSFDNYCERQLIVNDDVKVGEILVVEKPYSRSLLPDYFHTHCSHCFRRSLNLIPCPECTTTMFCCENCLNSANHSIECQYLGILVKLKVEKVQLLSLKILMDASNQGKNLKNLLKTVTEYENICSNDNNVKYYRSADFINIYNLVTNEGKRSNSDLFYRSVLSSVLILILESKTKFFETIQHSDYYSLRNFAGALLIHFLQVVPCNAHEVSEFSSDGLSEVGAGLYAILSLINHSCDPNVVRHSYRDTIVLRSIKPLKKGEQILDNYGYHYALDNFLKRQNSLMKQYYFKCECEACEQKWPVYELISQKPLPEKATIDIDLYEKLTKKFEEDMESVLDGEYTSALIERNMKYLDYIHKFVPYPWINYNKCQELIKYCLMFHSNYFKPV